jgi:hypothetical protein
VLANPEPEAVLDVLGAELLVFPVLEAAVLGVAAGF